MSAAEVVPKERDHTLSRVLSRPGELSGRQGVLLDQNLETSFRGFQSGSASVGSLSEVDLFAMRLNN